MEDERKDLYLKADNVNDFKAAIIEAIEGWIVFGELEYTNKEALTEYQEAVDKGEYDDIISAAHDMCLGLIYGSDYDTIGDVVADIAVQFTQEAEKNGTVETFSLTNDTVEQTIDRIFDATNTELENGGGEKVEWNDIAAMIFTEQLLHEYYMWHLTDVEHTVDLTNEKDEAIINGTA